MKKIIAILSVLLVAACVFAAVGDPDVAATKDSIRVSTKIIPVEPTFVLQTDVNGSTKVIDGTDDDHVGAGTTDGTIEYSKYVEAQGTTAEADPTSTGYKEDWISANYLLDNDATVTFGIYQRKVAISDLVYTLTATATDLTYVDGSVAGKSATANQKFACSDTTPSITAVTTGIGTDKLALSASDNVLTATYTGRVNNTDNDLQIGKFDVKWTKNASAEVGKYSADVTLTITTN